VCQDDYEINKRFIEYSKLRKIVNAELTKWPSMNVIRLKKDPDLDALKKEYRGKDFNMIVDELKIDNITHSNLLYQP